MTRGPYYSMGKKSVFPKLVCERFWLRNKSGYRVALIPTFANSRQVCTLLISICMCGSIRAAWKGDRNENGIADGEEQKCTVPCTDGVDGEELFADQAMRTCLLTTRQPRSTARRSGKATYSRLGRLRPRRRRAGGGWGLSSSISRAISRKTSIKPRSWKAGCLCRYCNSVPW